MTTADIEKGDWIRFYDEKDDCVLTGVLEYTYVGTSGSTVYVTDEGRVLIDDILEIRGMESRKWIVGQ